MDKELCKMFITACNQIFTFLSNGDSAFISAGGQYVKTYKSRMQTQQGKNELFLYLQKLLYITIEKKHNIGCYENHVRYLLDMFGSSATYKKYATYMCLKSDPKLGLISDKTKLCLLVEIAMIIMKPKLVYMIDNFMILLSYLKNPNAENKLDFLIMAKRALQHTLFQKQLPVMLVLVSESLEHIPGIPIERRHEIEEFRLDCLSLYRSAQDSTGSVLYGNLYSNELVELMRKHWNLGLWIREHLSTAMDQSGGIPGMSAVAGFFSKIGAKITGSAVARSAAKSAAKLAGEATKEITQSAVAGLSERLRDPSIYIPDNNKHTQPSARSDDMLYVQQQEIARLQRRLDQRLSNTSDEILRDRSPQHEAPPIEPSRMSFDEFVPGTPRSERIMEKEKLETAVAKENASEIEAEVRIDHYKNLMKAKLDFRNPVNYGPIQMDNLATLEMLHILKILASNKATQD